MVIYGIFNLKNGKKYIGSTTNFSRRKATHLRLLNANKHHSKHLQYAWNNSSSVDFAFIILEKIDNLENLFEREQYWIDYYKSYNNKYGYNCSKIVNQPEPTKKEIWQFNLDGTKLNKWNSIKEAADFYNLDSSGISKCSRGKYRYYGGFIWSIYEELDKKRINLANSSIKRSTLSKKKMSISAKNRKDRLKPILQFDILNNFIREWNSTSEVILTNNYSSSGSISECLHNKRKTAFGYIWKFKT